ncbi:MAG: MFS transporter [Candidatus Promineofilum sp.]|uniref:MFS transporter n=1 Tax=Promineifilum sp. TaxID=2664178 RepID=UPI002411ED8B|nr:MFS transporter [Promineifilum sp.]
MQKSELLERDLRARMASGLGPWLAGHAPLMSLAHLILEANFNFLPVTFVLLIPKLGLTYGQIGTLALLASLSGTLSQPLFGWLSDRGDPRTIVIGGLAWGGVLMGLVGFMPSYAGLAVLLALAALGSAAFHPPAAALSALTEAGNRGRAMSLFSVGGNLGAAVSPALVGLALGVVGLSATAVVIPLSLATAVLLARQLRRIQLPARGHGGGDAHPIAPGGSMAALVAIVVVVGARSYFQLALMTYLPEWLRADGQSLAMAGAALAIFMVAVSVGSLFGGSLSDRAGRLPVIAASLVVMMAGHWLLLRLSGLPQMASVVLVGTMIGASFPVTIVLAQEAWPRSVGFASAMVMGLGWLPAGLGAWAVGHIADGSSLTAGLGSLLFVPLVGVAALGVYASVTRRKPAAV